MTEKAIYDYFNTITAANSVMKLLHIGYLEDLNGDTLDSIYVAQQAKEYPVIVITPPVSYPDITNIEWEQFMFSLFFMEQKQFDNNNVVRPEAGNIIWTRMSEVARDYIVKLQSDILGGHFSNELRFIEGNRNVRIDRVKDFGNDKLAGARLDFIIEIFKGCATTSTFN